MALHAHVSHTLKQYFFPYFSFSHGDISNGKSHFLQTLMDAEAAAKAAAIQLMSFKHSMDDAVCVLQLAYHGFNTVIIINIISFSLVIKDSGSSATDKHQLTRQRRLLLEKLEHFRRTNKSVRQILKQLQDLEVGFNPQDQNSMLIFWNVKTCFSYHPYRLKNLRNAKLTP